MKKRFLALLLTLVMALGLTAPAFAANPMQFCEYDNQAYYEERGQVIAEFSDGWMEEAKDDYRGSYKIYHLPANATVTFHIPDNSDWWSLFRCNEMWFNENGLKNNVAYTRESLNAAIQELRVDYTATNTFHCEIMEMWEMTTGAYLFDIVFDGKHAEPSEPTNPTGSESDFVIRDGELLEYRGSGGNVIIPSGVTKIQDMVFYSKKNLISVIIPEGVTSIGNQVFSHCGSLTSVTIPTSVTSIGNSAFYECRNLTSVVIPEGVTSIGSDMFGWCQSLISMSIPTSVTDIGDRAFYMCGNLNNSIAIPAGVTSIGEDAFLGCKNLTDVVIPEGVTSIGNSAFYDCSNLTSVVIPSSVTSIGDMAFCGCSNLTSATISGTAASIGVSAFGGCRSLTSVTISKGVTSIGHQAFRECRSLTSVVIPSSVTSIGDSAFYDCSNLTSATISGTAVSIGDSAFCNCRSLARVSIVKGVASIGKHAFEGCESLNSVVIPSSVTSIGDSAFFDCKRLTNVTISEGVTSIGEKAFDACRKLSSVTVPSSVTSIEYCAFNGCSALKDVYYSGTEAQWKAISIEDGNGELTYVATIHYNSPMPKPITTAGLGLTVTGWAKAEVDDALAAGLYDEALGKNMVENITRAQAAAVAVKLYEAMKGKDTPIKDNPFTDTEDPNVIKAYSLGLIDGNGSGHFGPDDPLNREAVAVMLAKVYRKLGGTIPPASATTFADDGKISSWAKAEVSFMAEKGIVKGDGTSFNPQGPITGQEALILGLHMMNTLG